MSIFLKKNKSLRWYIFIIYVINNSSYIYLYNNKIYIHISSRKPFINTWPIRLEWLPRGQHILKVSGWKSSAWVILLMLVVKAALHWQDQSTNQAIKQSTNQPSNQSIKHPTTCQSLPIILLINNFPSLPVASFRCVQLRILIKVVLLHT